MSQRVVRVNELLKREISLVMHTRFQEEAVAISIIDVEAAPSLRKAKVFYATAQDAEGRSAAEAFFRRHAGEIQREVSQRIVLKFFPRLEFLYDPAGERGARLNALLDELGLEGEPPPEPPDASSLPPRGR